MICLSHVSESHSCWAGEVLPGNPCANYMIIIFLTVLPKSKESGIYFEGFRSEWYICTVYHCKDMPFWSETLDFISNYLGVGGGGWGGDRMTSKKRVSDSFLLDILICILFT